VERDKPKKSESVGQTLPQLPWKQKRGDLKLSTSDLRNYWTEFHETWWSYRYMFLVDPKVFRFVVSHIFMGSKGVGVAIESYGKLEISYINVDNF
jgi:hypothetical protein